MNNSDRNTILQKDKNDASCHSTQGSQEDQSCDEKVDRLQPIIGQRNDTIEVQYQLLIKKYYMSKMKINYDNFYMVRKLIGMHVQQNRSSKFIHEMTNRFLGHAASIRFESFAYRVLALFSYNESVKKFTKVKKGKWWQIGGTAYNYWSSNQGQIHWMEKDPVDEKNNKLALDMIYSKPHKDYSEIYRQAVLLIGFMDGDLKARKIAREYIPRLIKASSKEEAQNILNQIEQEVGMIPEFTMNDVSVLCAKAEGFKKKNQNRRRYTVSDCVFDVLSSIC